MIAIPSNVRVWLAAGHTDMRRGMNGLALQVQEGLQRDPHVGDLFVFRGKRGDLACRLNHSVLYLRVPKLFSDLAMARGDGQYARIMRTVSRVEVLILDDWGLSPLDANARHDLLEILEERHGRRSTVVTSQLPVDRWHDIIGDPTYADAILDRLVHTAHRIALDGDSLRKARTRGGIPKTPSNP